MKRTLLENLAALEAQAKRGKSGKERVTYNVDASTVRAFRAICDAKGIEYSHVIELFMRDYVGANQGQVLEISQVPKKLG